MDYEQLVGNAQIDEKEIARLTTLDLPNFMGELNEKSNLN
jgi:hypothetical protein